MSEDAIGHVAPLPPGWCWAKLGQCSELLQYGSSAKTNKDMPGVPVLRMGNIRQDGSLDLDDLKYLPEKHDEFPALLLESGDLVFNRTNSAELVGKTGVYRGVPSPCSFASYLIRVRLHDSVLPTLVAACLNSGHGRRWINSVVNQTVGQANVNGTKLAAFEFPLPPHNEQQRIVETLDELFSDLDAGVAALERVRTKLRHYRAAVLKAAVEGALTAEWRKQHPATEPASALLTRILAERRRRWEQDQLRKFAAADKVPPTNWKAKYKEPVAPDRTNLSLLPKGWSWATVDQLTCGHRSCAYGVLQPGPHVEDGIPLVRVGDINFGKVDVSNLKRISPSIASDYVRTCLEGRELLITLVGTIGRTAVVPKSLKGANTARAVGVIPLSELVIPEWVEIWFRNVGKQNEMTLKSHEVARKTLNLEDVRPATVAVPTVEEQLAIVEAVEDQLSVLEHIEADVAAKLKSAQALRQSILRHAFTGQLVPQDPHDEPASELLKRLAADRDQRTRQATASKSDSRKRTTRRKKP